MDVKFGMMALIIINGLSRCFRSKTIELTKIVRVLIVRMNIIKDVKSIY